MEMVLKIVQFIIFSGLIVIISKQILVKNLRELAESLKLKPKIVGDIAGVATSVPELLTIGISSFNGLISTSIYNVVSSNIINLIQYFSAIFSNKNQKNLKNRAIKVDLLLVIITILIPILIIVMKIELKIVVVPAFVILYIGFKKINNNVHKLYLKEIEKEIEDDENCRKNSSRTAAKNVLILTCAAIALFIIGELLGNTLESLSGKFNVPEFVLGIVLGFVTSLPELITFIESQKHHKNLENDMIGVVEATNNLLMSNVLNLFIIQSIGILIFTILYG